MIRPYRPDDLETLLSIWLEASSRAHDFVARSFWEARLDDMRNLYLPAAQTWVYERDGTLVGFVSLLDDILAAIFVAPAEQGAGIGSALLEHAKPARAAEPDRLRRQQRQYRLLSSSRLPSRRRATGRTHRPPGTPDDLAASGVGRRRRRLAVVMMALQCDLPDRQPNLRR